MALSWAWHPWVNNNLALMIKSFLKIKTAHPAQIMTNPHDQVVISSISRKLTQIRTGACLPMSGLVVFWFNWQQCMLKFGMVVFLRRLCHFWTCRFLLIWNVSQFQLACSLDPPPQSINLKLGNLRRVRWMTSSVIDSQALVVAESQEWGSVFCHLSVISLSFNRIYTRVYMLPRESLIQRLYRGWSVCWSKFKLLLRRFLVLE